MENINLKWLQDWFFQNCNGRWEKKERFHLRNIDNPGWLLTLQAKDLTITPQKLNKIIIDRTEDDWLHSLFKNNEFISAGGPFNLNEVLHYFRCWIEEKKETTIIKGELTNWMQKWFFQYCDDDWEHSGRFDIKTTDNPGWYFSFNFEDTHCENKPFDSIEIKKSNVDWYKCFIEDTMFKGYGGVFNLIDMIKVFRTWAEKCQNDYTI